MRTVPVLAGIAAMALAGFSVAALARSPAVHSMTLNLPGGGTEHITYTGDTPPKVIFYRGSDNPFASAFFGWHSPFAALDRISAQMDRQVKMLMQGAHAMPLLAFPNRPMQVGVQNMPRGAASFSMISTMSGNHVCMHSMQITTDTHGKRQVEQHTSGDCQGVNVQGPANLSSVPEHPQQSPVIQARDGNAPFQYSSGLVSNANYSAGN